MKITIDEGDATQKYPYVGSTSQGTIVLFIALNRGVCLISTQSHVFSAKVGEYSTSWVEYCFTPISGTITIECP